LQIFLIILVKRLNKQFKIKKSLKYCQFIGGIKLDLGSIIEVLKKLKKIDIYAKKII